MHPFVSLLGKPFSTYGIFAMIGMAFVVVYSFIVHKATGNKKDFFSHFLFLVYCGAFGALGAATLFQLTVLKNNIQALPYLFTDFQEFLNRFSFGLVFYGGMFGIFVGFMVYSQYFKEDTRDWVRTSVASIPLFHFFGRLGCTVGGCCFGKVVEFQDTGKPLIKGFSVYNARIGAYCIPIQPIEAAGLLVIFIILLVYTIKQKNKKEYYRTMGLYFILYGILRFVVEFFRGDLIRGIWGPFSTSQWISLILLPIGIYCLACPAKKSIFEKWFNGAQYRKSDNTKNATKNEAGKAEAETNEDGAEGAAKNTKEPAENNGGDNEV